jgi:hypothetical protein
VRPIKEQIQHQHRQVLLLLLLFRQQQSMVLLMIALDILVQLQLPSEDRHPMVQILQSHLVQLPFVLLEVPPLLHELVADVVVRDIGDFVDGAGDERHPIYNICSIIKYDMTVLQMKTRDGWDEMVSNHTRPPG